MKMHNPLRGFGCRTVRILWLGALILAAGSTSFAGDQKPFHGRLQEIDVRPMTLTEAQDFEFLNDIIDVLGPPPVMQWMTLNNLNNVGGKSLSVNAQILYLGISSALLYEVSTVAVANGDEYFLTVEGIFDYATVSSEGVFTVIGGTGRFLGVEGSGEFTAITQSDGTAAVDFDGFISTVGEAKQH